MTSVEYSLRIGGKNVWFAANVSPLSANSVIWAARDITDRKGAEQQIEKQLETLGALYDL